VSTRKDMSSDVGRAGAPQRRDAVPFAISTRGVSRWIVL
jgi:hypothetical protein